MPNAGGGKAFDTKVVAGDSVSNAIVETDRLIHRFSVRPEAANIAIGTTNDWGLSVADQIEVFAPSFESAKESSLAVACTTYCSKRAF
jgi:hypothetical protein